MCFVYNLILWNVSCSMPIFILFLVKEQVHKLLGPSVGKLLLLNIHMINCCDLLE
jgi:hypothetical protein